MKFHLLTKWNQNLCIGWIRLLYAFLNSFIFIKSKYKYKHIVWPQCSIFCAYTAKNCSLCLPRIEINNATRNCGPTSNEYIEREKLTCTIVWYTSACKKKVRARKLMKKLYKHIHSSTSFVFLFNFITYFNPMHLLDIYASYMYINIS